MKLDNQTYRFTEKGRLGTIALVLGIAGLLASAAGLMQDSRQFYHSYLVAFFFWFSVALGALFFTMLHHLTRAGWSTVLRRMSECTMSVIPYMLVLFIPVIIGMHELFHWSHADAVAADELLQKKAPYLNVSFFIVRVVVYFLVWTWLALGLSRLSTLQDDKPDDSLLRRMRKYSAPGMIAFAFTLTFASIDWLMSLEPHWYSTIFGVYIFCGVVISVVSFLIIIIGYQRSRGVLIDEVTVEHRQTLGKLLFAFTIMWAYMGFSQYMLIWYANLPEEAFWFLQRWEGSWKIMSVFLPIGHFGVPFVTLIARGSKRSVNWLLFMAVYMLVMRYIDLYWIVMPNLHPEAVQVSWMDLTTMLGVGGVFIWLFWRKYTGGPAVPVKDPSLKLSISHVN